MSPCVWHFTGIIISKNRKFPFCVKQEINYALTQTQSYLFSKQHRGKMEQNSHLLNHHLPKWRQTSEAGGIRLHQVNTSI